MIRHITTRTKYNQIISDKKINDRFILTGKSRTLTENGYVSFEEYKGNNNFIYIFFEQRFRDAFKKFKEYDDRLIAIYIDENILIKDNIDIYKTKVLSDMSTCDNGYFNKLECIFRFIEPGAKISKKHLDDKKFKSIGDYVYVKAPIDIKYIHHIEEFNYDEIDNIRISMGL